MPFSLGTQLVSLWVWGHAIELPEGDLLRACYSREGHSISGLVCSKDGAQIFPWVADACAWRFAPLGTERVPDVWQPQFQQRGARRATNSSARATE